MKNRLLFPLILFTVILTIFATPRQAGAQCGGAGAPCPPTAKPTRPPKDTPAPPEDNNGSQRKTATALPAASTPTATVTSTPTNTPTATATFTPTETPTPTQLPGADSGSARATDINWMPGIGIGSLILVFILAVLLPAVQKVRVKKRGY